MTYNQAHLRNDTSCFMQVYFYVVIPLPWITIFLEITNIKGRHSVMWAFGTQKSQTRLLY